MTDLVEYEGISYHVSRQGRDGIRISPVNGGPGWEWRGPYEIGYSFGMKLLDIAEKKQHGRSNS